MLRRTLKNLAGGFLMGSADIVPGVSGGTIALVIGIYERLVASIKEGSSALGYLAKGDIPRMRRHLSGVEWAFLVPLLLGILLAVGLLSTFLTHQLEDRPVVLSAAFFGLVAGSVVVAWRLFRAPEWRYGLVVSIVGVVLFLVLGLGEAATVADPGSLAFFGAGAVAICAMILPGISGSLILVLIGMYESVLSSVTDRQFGRLGVFIGGAVVGLALFSQFLHWALARYHDLVLAILIGLMAGSLRILWPWPDGVNSSALSAPGVDSGKAVVAAFVGALAVVAISKLAGAKTAS